MLNVGYIWVRKDCLSKPYLASVSLFFLGMAELFFFHFACKFWHLSHSVAAGQGVSATGELPLRATPCPGAQPQALQSQNAEVGSGLRGEKHPQIKRK